MTNEIFTTLLSAAARAFVSGTCETVLLDEGTGYLWSVTGLESRATLWLDACRASREIRQMSTP